MPIPEKNWKANEVGIRRNGDYDYNYDCDCDYNCDCGSTIVGADWTLDVATTDEDDLIRLDINVTSVTGIEYRLKATDSQPVVRLWNSEQKGDNPINSTGDGIQITADKTVYAEYISAGNNHVTFELIVIDTINDLELFTEELVYRPFNSVTAAFVGENQTAGNPTLSPGVNNWVIQELLNGYDVWVWDDGHDWWNWDDADEWGRGTAHDEIVNAINNRGITQVSLLGYSHGGGTVYNMAWRLHNNYEDSSGHTITNPYQLVFTSYIDAVSNSNWTNFFEENRRPLGSLYHLGQYETTSTVNGGPLDSDQESDGDADSSEAEDTENDGYDIDRTYLGVTHSGIQGIHINYIVLELLTTKFEQKTNR
jgi:hypothetical protein